MFCLSNCVAMQPGLRRHVSPAASGRNLGYVVTQFGGIGRTVTCYVG